MVAGVLTGDVGSPTVFDIGRRHVITFDVDGDVYQYYTSGYRANAGQYGGKA